MKYRNLLAVITGSLLPFLTRLILYPIVRIVFEKYFHLFDRENKTDDLIISINLILWIFIATLSGGVDSYLMAKSNEWTFIVLNTIVIFSILTVLTNGAIFQDSSLDAILAALMIPFGYLTGGIAGSIVKRKRRKKIEMLISNIPSSQTGTAEQ